MRKRKRRAFTAEFKQEAVRLCEIEPQAAFNVFSRVGLASMDFNKSLPPRPCRSRRLMIGTVSIACEDR